MTNSWLSVLCAIVIIGPPFLFGVVPVIGCVVAKSRWTPFAWVGAVGSAACGFLLHREGLPVDRRVALVLWVPLYHLAVYTLILYVFLRIFHKRPRYTPTSFAEGFGWDRAFTAIVILTGILPVVPFFGPT